MSKKNKNRITELEEQINQLKERINELEDAIFVDAVGTEKVPDPQTVQPIPTSPPPYPKEWDRKDGISWGRHKTQSGTATWRPPPGTRVYYGAN